MAIRIAIVGMGKIAHDQHLPSIAGNPDFALAATVSARGGPAADVPVFRTLEELLASDVAIDAVALCTPPQVRRALAHRSLDAGKHVFLEKPPGATLAEVAALDDQARAAGLTLFASWHSRFAPGVAPARAWLRDKAIGKVGIVWREDVRTWHPGQAWIWEPGGLGVFDPGINALSIATGILPRPFFLTGGTLFFPGNREAPIAALLDFTDAAGTPISMDLDWRQTGPQNWDVRIDTDAGTLVLSRGGAELTLPGGAVAEASGGLDTHEYPALYARFAELVKMRESDVDVAPLRLVADAFLRGRRETAEDFHD